MIAWIALMAAAAQGHDMHAMPGMTMPQAAPKPKARARPQPRRATSAPSPVDHAGMDHSQMDHGQMDHDMPAAAAAAAAPAQGTDLPPGDAPPPPVPLPHYADRFWDPAEMVRGRDIMMSRDGGGRTFATIRVDLAEYQTRGRGYRWDGEGWFGGDIDRLVVKSEGEGARRGGVDAAEVQALYSRAIGPYFNVQGGVRQDIRPTPARTYATIGVEGLAPYWFEVEANAFLSTHGELLGRVEGYYDQRITQRLVLQPRAELNLSAQDVRATGVGSGLTSAELGLRLRYEIKREFAPYVGVSWERRLGDTARMAGGDRGGVTLVAGLRTWF